MVDPAWVLQLMLVVQPRAPWLETYPETAAAIAAASEEEPLFSGKKGAEKTAALLVSVAWFEGAFRPDAEGDHRAGKPTSFCAMQVNQSNFAALGTTREELLRNVRACVRAGLRMMRISFGVCRRETLEHRLDHYASGGEGCRRPARDEGAHRVRKALWLFSKHPPPEPREEASTRVDAEASGGG